MTAVGAWLWEGIPVLIGDIALAGVDDESSAVLPTVKSVEVIFPKGSGYVVSGAVQKVVVLSDNLAVGWAGPRLAAAEAIGALRDLAQRQVSAESVGIALGRPGNCATSRDLTLIGWVRSERDWCQFVFEGLSFRVVAASEATFAGSGAGGLRSAYEFATSAEVTGESDRRLVCACRCAAMMGQLMRSEMSFSKPLLEYYGGGYEAACVRFDRLQKLDVVVHVFWTGEFDGAELRLQPTRILRNAYDGERLLVRAADVRHEGDTDELVLAEQVLHVIRGPERVNVASSVGSEAPWAPNFGAPITCSHVLVRNGRRTLGIVNNVNSKHVLSERARKNVLLVPKGLYDAIGTSVRSSLLASA